MTCLKVFIKIIIIICKMGDVTCVFTRQVSAAAFDAMGKKSLTQLLSKNILYKHFNGLFYDAQRLFSTISHGRFYYIIIVHLIYLSISLCLYFYLYEI